MKKKKQPAKFKSLIIISVILAALFIIIFFLSDNKSSVISKGVNNDTTIKNPKNSSFDSPESVRRKSKSIKTKQNVAGKSKDEKKSNLKKKKNESLETSTTKLNSKAPVIKNSSKVKSSTDLKQNVTNKVKTKSIKSKSTKVSKKPKVYKYSKRFLQIDQDLKNYSVLKGVFYIPNTTKNRKKYPSGVIQESFIKVKSSKELKGDSVLQNKSTRNFSLFKRIVTFQVKEEMGSKLLNDLKAFRFVDMNELSMINYKYVLKFKSPEDAFKAYSLIKGKSYLKWSSVDVFEFIKINE